MGTVPKKYNQMTLEVALPLKINKNFDYLSDEDVKIGCRVVVPFNKEKLTGFVVAVRPEPSLKIPLKKVIKIVDKEPLITAELIGLAEWISQYYLCSLGSALNLILPQASKLSSKEMEIPLRRLRQAEKKVVHTGEQKAAAEKVINALNQTKQKTFLLYGMNDSGKTEVYFQAIDWCLRNDRSAVYMVPDVSLTSQFKELLRDRFGESLAVWHSGLSQKEKKQFLHRLKLKKIKVVLGTRSAVFLPLENIKLFILDEEDDDFYKNVQTPKYHARDVAVQRAGFTGAVVVLGSATPSVETYHKTRTGEIETLKLSDRIDNRPLPKVTVVDLKYIHAFWRIITKPLRYAISNALLQKKQIFLLVNRRGWATSARCSSCNDIIKCPKCSIPLIVHKNPQMLLCHYCGYRQKILKNCPVCNSNIVFSGYGTERIEDIVKKLFPSAEIIRMDADTEIPYSKMFNIMKLGRPCILVGTQIVAKGFDFQNITVVGIINAYSGLYSADFRSAERNFSLITHSIGRCGRGSSPGQVIIQTDNPEHYSIKYAAEFDYEMFFEKEIKFRKEFSWPPFVKLISITISGKDEKNVIDESEKIAEKLDKLSQNIGLTPKNPGGIYTGLTVLGPVPKVSAYLAGKHRWQILLKLKENEYVNSVKNIREIVERHQKKSVNVVFDVDPLETV
ncbi:MAG: primosomal protein N' [Elusimicrobia bacterium]|nr:primosomal protein N' [Elusimicrobiota bacterium]